MKHNAWLSVCLAATITAACTAGLTADISQPHAAAVDDGNDDWLHAEGSRLYDKDGNEVWLTGANWFGLNCNEAIPHYLWSGDCDDMLSEVADRGINVIRFPISTELIVSWMNGTPNEVGSVQASYNPPKDEDDGNGGIIPAGKFGKINIDFVQEDGKTLKTSEEIFDVILGKCKKYGIKAFIDIHSPHTDNSGHNYNLWYGKAGVTTDVWIDSLVWMANKYKNDDTLIGYDLKNEPHGKGQEGAEAAKWDGSKDENNWAYAATRCADAILEVNPNALIFIEGVEQSMSGAQEGDYWGMPDRKTNSPYIGAWWGGNFRGAREYPIKPAHGTSQIVYSPHDYGPSVYAQTWFDKDFTEKTLLDDYWYDTWAYINAENIAPELIGEWGGHMDGAENQKWMTLLRDYMINHHINHTFWCLNTNSGDTGGLWSGFLYDQAAQKTTITWEENKYKLFEESLWQTQSSGKYIGLDHQRPLGVNGTGISVAEYYKSYDSSEGSNLDGGTKGGKKGSKADIVTTPDDPKVTTAAPKETTAPPKDETTVTSVTTTTAPVTTTIQATDGGPVTTAPNARQAKYGDADENTEVDVADAVLISRFAAEDKEVSLTAQGKVNADVNGNGKPDPDDAVKVLKFIAKLISEKELAP